MSELRTNRIVPRDGVPSGSFGGGIVQVRYAQQDSRIQLTSEGDLVSASITPLRTDSKIMVDMRARARSAGTNTASWYVGLKSEMVSEMAKSFYKEEKKVSKKS